MTLHNHAGKMQGFSRACMSQTCRVCRVCRVRSGRGPRAQKRARVGCLPGLQCTPCIPYIGLTNSYRLALRTLRFQKSLADVPSENKPYIEST